MSESKEEIREKVYVGWHIPSYQQDKLYYIVTIRENLTNPELSTILLKEHGDAKGFFRTAPCIEGAIELGEKELEEAVDSALQETEHAYLVDKWTPMSGICSIAQTYMAFLYHRDDCYCRQH